ncbi:uncharacterized protein LOC128234476 [Mya arenaria]|uniref:uncharacterized protein LOC128234476 n=1 Tax=Mya arenaria TaxID=6604 RepID=UPI0022E0C1D6|nr:uncharacterized protein LOC128234476 [Mya arenaria]
MQQYGFLVVLFFYISVDVKAENALSIIHVQTLVDVHTTQVVDSGRSQDVHITDITPATRRAVEACAVTDIRGRVAFNQFVSDRPIAQTVEHVEHQTCAVVVQAIPDQSVLI